MNIVLISIFGYVAFLMGISLWHKKKNYHANEDFLIADRKLSGIIASFTLIASFIGGGTLLGNTALIFKFGYYILPLLIRLCSTICRFSLFLVIFNWLIYKILF